MINQLRKLLKAQKEITEVKKEEIEKLNLVTIATDVTHEEKMRKKYSRTILRNAERMRNQIEQLIKEGLCFSEIKCRIGASYDSCAKWMEILQLNPPKKVKKPHPLIKEIKKARKAGLKYAEIGRIHGITRERVRQIVAEYAPELTVFNYKKIDPEKEDFSDLPTGKKKKKSPLHIDRDLMEKIIELRKQSMTWDQVAKKLCPSLSGVILRVQIQRWIDIILTKSEREEFFRRNRKPRYRP